MSGDEESQLLITGSASTTSSIGTKSIVVPVTGCVLVAILVAGIIVASVLAWKYSPGPPVIVQWASCRAGTAVCPNGLVITCPMGADSVPCVQSSSSSASSFTGSSSSAGGGTGVSTGGA